MYETKTEHVYNNFTSNKIMFDFSNWAWQTEYFIILRCFLLFYPLTIRKTKFWRKKKATRDITILYMCTINYNHMVYVSWDLEHDGLNFLSFCHFYSTNNTENQDFEKNEKQQQQQPDIIILQKCTKNHDHMLYAILVLRCGMWWM